MIPLHASAPAAVLDRLLRCLYCGRVDPRCHSTEIRITGVQVYICVRAPFEGVSW